MSYNLTKVIAQRENKVVYKDAGKTIKLFVEDHPKSYILNEALNQARVEESTDLNIPKLIEVTKIDNRWALVFEHIEGETLETLMQKNPDKLDEYLDLFVNIQLEILSKTAPLIYRVKEKFKTKINNSQDIDDGIKYELLQRLEGMKNHTKLCHGDFNPSNIVIKEDGSYYILDWAHVTQGNASADVARTYLLFAIQGKNDLADKYLNLFAQKSGIEVKHIQRWIPIVAATQLTKGVAEERDILLKWVNVAEYQ